MIISSLPLLPKLLCCHIAWSIFCVPQVQTSLDCVALSSQNFWGGAGTALTHDAMEISLLLRAHPIKKRRVPTIKPLFRTVMVRRYILLREKKWSYYSREGYQNADNAASLDSLQSRIEIQNDWCRTITLSTIYRGRKNSEMSIMAVELIHPISTLLTFVIAEHIYTR
jgi:hypothetical protein